MVVKIFISYATKDSNIFHIGRTAMRLKDFPGIKDVFYWEEDMHDDIYKYMNEYIGKCDIFLAFCSKNALKSESVEIEWMAALRSKKKIIPIFTDEGDIPLLLGTKLGIEFRKNNRGIDVSRSR